MRAVPQAHRLTVVPIGSIHHEDSEDEEESISISNLHLADLDPETNIILPEIPHDQNVEPPSGSFTPGLQLINNNFAFLSHQADKLLSLEMPMLRSERTR